MAVPSISYIVGAFFAFVGIVGVLLNFCNLKTSTIVDCFEYDSVVRDS